MTDFENYLIKADEPYSGGFFPVIPNWRKEGSAFILTGGIGNDLLVTDRTTTKELRQGKYTRLIEISTRPYLKELHFTAPSKEPAYSFSVYVKAVIQVEIPLTFYVNRNLDVDTYFENLFSMDVRKITRKYSILDYAGMDDELTVTLSAYHNFDESTGFSYSVSAVLAEPDEKAADYVQRSSKQVLEMEIKAQARALAESLSTTLPEALMTAVAEGRMTLEEALQQIAINEEQQFETKLGRIDALRKKNIITEEETRNYARAHILGAAMANSNGLEDKADSDGEGNLVDALYEEDK